VLCGALLILANCATVAPTCQPTLPNGSTPPGEAPSANYHGNGRLWTALWPDGVVRFEADGPGSVMSDGSMAMKFPWWRGEGVVGPLKVEGRRLDGEAPPLGAQIPDGYGDTGFQASALIFPTEGCWEVTAHAGDAELTFIARVVGPQGTD
jgi:hypothetical protein